MSEILLANIIVSGDTIKLNIYDGEYVKEQSFESFGRAINTLVNNNYIIKTETKGADGSRSLWFEGRRFGKAPY